jgi:hypothetical protein
MERERIPQRYIQTEISVSDTPPSAMEKKKITQVGYFNGKFLYSPTGWPEEPKYDVKCHSTHSCICASLAFENGANRDVVDGYDDNCPHRYQKALSSAIAQAVEFEDQERIEGLVIDHNGTEILTVFSNMKAGIYTIPPTEIEVVDIPTYVHKASDFDSIIQGVTYKKVARLVTQQSEPKKNQPPNFDSPKNWKEDYEHENGNYICTCYSCKESFYGHKRRVVCKTCASEPSPVEEKDICPTCGDGKERIKWKLCPDIFHHCSKISESDLAFVASYQRDNKHYVESPAVEETQEELWKEVIDRFGDALLESHISELSQLFTITRKSNP